MSNILRTYTFVLVCILSFFRVTASEKYSLGTHSEMEKIEWDNSLILPALDGNPNIGVAGAFPASLETIWLLPAVQISQTQLLGRAVIRLGGIHCII